MLCINWALLQLLRPAPLEASILSTVTAHSQNPTLTSLFRKAVCTAWAAASQPRGWCDRSRSQWTITWSPQLYRGKPLSRYLLRRRRSTAALTTPSQEAWRRPLSTILCGSPTLLHVASCEYQPWQIYCWKSIQSRIHTTAVCRSMRTTRKCAAAVAGIRPHSTKHCTILCQVFKFDSRLKNVSASMPIQYLPLPENSSGGRSFLCWVSLVEIFQIPWDRCKSLTPSVWIEWCQIYTFCVLLLCRTFLRHSSTVNSTYCTVHTVRDFI